MKKIEVKKNCDNCVKNSTCKFLHEYRKLVTTNMFYEMFEYSEWNNLEEIFKKNAAHCKHYHPMFQNGKLELAKVGYDIFYKAIKEHVGDNLKSVGISRPNNKLTLTINTKDGAEVTVEEIENLFNVEIL